MSIELGGGQYIELPTSSMLPIFGELTLDGADCGNLKISQPKRRPRDPEDMPNVDVGEDPVDY